MMADLWYLSAKEVGVLLRRREVSALEVVQAMLARIESLDSQFNAFITVTADEAQDAAKRLDAELADGRDRGPLHGIPVAIKDLYDTAGVRTTSGSKILANNVPDNDATSVAKLARQCRLRVCGPSSRGLDGRGILTTDMVDNSDSLRDGPNRLKIDTRYASTLTGRGPQRAGTALFPLILGRDLGHTIGVV